MTTNSPRNTRNRFSGLRRATRLSSVAPTRSRRGVSHGREIAANTALVGPAAGGFTPSTTVSGDLTISVDNTVVTEQIVNGSILVNARNVTVQGCRAVGGIRHLIDDAASIIRYNNIGPDSTYTRNADSDIAVTAGWLYFGYNNAHNGPDILRLAGGAGFTPITECNWLHTPEDPSDIDPHADIAQLDATSGDTVVRRNFLDASLMYFNTTTANPPAGRRLSTLPNTALIYGGHWTNGVCTVEDNLLIGGVYTADFLDGEAANGASYVVNGNWFGAGTVVTDTGGSEPFPRSGPVNTGNTDPGQISAAGNRLAVLSGGTWVDAGPLSIP